MDTLNFFTTFRPTLAGAWIPAVFMVLVQFVCMAGVIIASASLWLLLMMVPSCWAMHGVILGEEKYYIDINAPKQCWDGTKIYDPQRGFTAKMSAAFTDETTLRITGTVLGLSGHFTPAAISASSAAGKAEEPLLA